MPTIQRTKYPFENERNFVREVKCDAGGEFTCRLPDTAASLLGRTEVCGRSLKEVLQNFHEAIEEYKAINTTRRRVILYQVKMNAYVFEGEFCVLNRDDISFTAGVAVAVMADVYEEVKISGPKGCQYTYERKDSKLPRSIQKGTQRLAGGFYKQPFGALVEWSEERELFFCRLGLALERIAMELDKLSSPDKVLGMIAAGARLTGIHQLPLAATE